MNTPFVEDREHDEVHWFKDADGDFRWHRVAPNNKIISVSGEGYENKEDMMKMAQDLNPGIEIKAHEE